jgi:hypothetical protein
MSRQKITLLLNDSVYNISHWFKLPARAISYRASNALSIIVQVQSFLLAVLIFHINLLAFIGSVELDLDLCRLPKAKEALMEKEEGKVGVE